MTKLETLYDDLHVAGIAVNDYQISDTKKAACIKVGGVRTIALNKSALETQSEELVVLGEEHSHYETGTLRLLTGDYNSVQNRINRIADEARARRYNIERLIPIDELLAGMNTCVNADGIMLDELAELLEITEELLYWSLEYYSGLGYKW